MGASATLRQAAVSVEAGATASCEIAVRNAGRVVDEFTFEVGGDAAQWITVEPAKLSLFPGAEATAQVRFQPPRASTTPAGTIPFAIIIVSREDPEAKSVEEGTVEVAPFFELSAEILPRTSRGSFSGKHQLAVDNRGNAKINAMLEAFDPDELLRLDIRPPAIVGEPGTATLATVRVRPKDRFLRGEPQTRPFQVEVRSEGAPAIRVDANYLQEAIIPRSIPKLLAVLAAIVAALAIAWFTILQPAVESEAKESADKATAAGVSPLDARLKKLEAAGGGGGGGGTQATQSPTPPTDVRGTKLTAEGDPFDRRISKPVGENTPPGTTASTSAYTVEDGEQLSITDLLIQNPHGDSGVLRIYRNTSTGRALLLEERLENFRDLDYHFVTPLVFGEGESISLDVQCSNAGQGTACTPALYFTGTIQNAPS